MRLSRHQAIVAFGASAIPAKAMAWSDRRRVLIHRSLRGIARHLSQGAIAIDRIGIYRLGKDDMVLAAVGSSSISKEDCASASINEAMVPPHHRERFIMGY